MMLLEVQNEKRKIDTEKKIKNNKIIHESFHANKFE